MIKFVCPKCHAWMQANSKHSGKQATCKCGEGVVVPTRIPEDEAESTGALPCDNCGEAMAIDERVCPFCQEAKTEKRLAKDAKIRADMMRRTAASNAAEAQQEENAKGEGEFPAAFAEENFTQNVPEEEVPSAPSAPFSAPGGPDKGVTSPQKKKAYLERIRRETRYGTARGMVNVFACLASLPVIFCAAGSVWMFAKFSAQQHLPEEKIFALGVFILVLLVCVMGLAFVVALRQLAMIPIDIADSLVHEHSKR